MRRVIVSTSSGGDPMSGGITFYAEVGSYNDLRSAFRMRTEQLNISRECLDDVSGLPKGYAGKLLSKRNGKNAKCFGPLSFDLFLKSVGLRLVLMDDPEALARVRPLFVKRAISQVRTDDHWRNRAAPAEPRVPKSERKARLWNGRRDPKGKA